MPLNRGTVVPAAIAIFLSLDDRAPFAGSMRHVWPESGFASILFPQRRSITFIPCRLTPPFLAKQESVSAPPFTLFRRVILPGALPAIFTGLRYALGIMWLTLIVAETISSSSGLGYMAMQAREFLLIDVVVLSILIYALLGKLADSFARFLESIFLQWHPAFKKV